MTLLWRVLLIVNAITAPLDAAGAAKHHSTWLAGAAAFSTFAVVLGLLIARSPIDD